ncbi:MAG: carbohydrate-binding family 9-like protein [Bacteroidia bacterium]|nr:carbohydrate-binding family 9-like protein [Bacteroidia bacterium]
MFSKSSKWQCLAFIASLVFFIKCNSLESVISPNQHTKVYQCHFIHSAPTIDGNGNESIWKQAKWSESFVDIEGAKKAMPFYDTKMKMLWDSSYLYILANLEEEHIWGYVTEKNIPIYKYGNDFEVFIDPDRDHHNYYELELNVLNTIWELTLEKPYRNGGPAIDPTNLPGLKTAVGHNGTVNDPSDVDTNWVVEIAIPFQDLYDYRKNYTRVLTQPRPIAGDIWGINFSRVHWDHEINNGKYQQVPNRPEYNWVWSQQGEINMHAPEKWGLLMFTDSTYQEPKWRENKVRDQLMGLYKLQEAFKKENGFFASTIDEVDSSFLKLPYVDKLIINSDGEQYEIMAHYKSKDDQEYILKVDESSLLVKIPNTNK